VVPAVGVVVVALALADEEMLVELEAARTMTMLLAAETEFGGVEVNTTPGQLGNEIVGPGGEVSVMVVFTVLGEVLGVVFADEVLRVLFAGRLDVFGGGLDVFGGGLDVFGGGLDVFGGGLDVFAGGLLGVLGGGEFGELGTGNEPWTYTVLETHRTCY
jgi:hypothetical protein